MTAGELGTLIAAVSAAIVAIINAIKTTHVQTKVSEVHQEVKTMNGLALGQLADASETRRVADIPPDDRTPQETKHLAVLPLDQPQPSQPESSHE